MLAEGVLMASTEQLVRESVIHVADGDDWMKQAACKGLSHLFFPAPAERPQARDRREATAAAVCSDCHVRGSCQEFARTNHEYGFWGGESEDERHAAGYRLIAPIGVRARAG